MDGGIALILLFVVGIPLAIWLIARALRARNDLDELSRRLGNLEREVSQLKSEGQKDPEYRPIKTFAPEAERPSAEKPMAPVPAPQPKVEHQSPPPIPAPTPASRSEPAVSPPPIQPEPLIAKVRTPLPFSQPLPPPRPPPARINWEQFMGVKMFAWVGGLALFLGVAFFVKYSFDNNLIPAEMRVAIGFAVGIALLVGGVVISRKNYLVLSHTLCATGVVILYAITFAARAYYHFLTWPGVWWDALPAFGIMVLITATGFLLAVRLNALVVAILGMLGGFLTPILLSTGVDNPGGLFGYIAILDVGLVIVALTRRWFFLTAMAAACTALMEIAWAGEFFVVGKYFEGNKIFIPFTILAGFNALYLLAAWWTRRRGQANRWLSGSALALATVALGFTAAFLTFEPLAQRPWLIFGFVFVIDLGIVALVLLDETVATAQPLAGMAVFGLLAVWTAHSLTNELLTPALTFYFVFAVLHAVFPVVLQKKRGSTRIAMGGQIFPPLALLLVLMPILHLTELSFIVWPFVLLVDVLAIGLAVVTASIIPVVIVLLLTLGATGALILKIPTDTLTGMPMSFLLLGAFAVFFFAVSLWLIRKYSPDVFKTGLRFGEDLTNPADVAAILPACSVVLPFLLLILATLRLPMASPSPVFGLAMLLVVLLLGVTKLLSLDWMPAIGLVSVTALECAWHFNHLEPSLRLHLMTPTVSLAWYLGFLAVFAAFPFLFLRTLSEKVLPWAAAAMAGPLQFLIIYRLVKLAYPNDVMGLLPAAFAIPGLLSLVIILKRISFTNPARMSQLGWFGGVALFFITLIFPIQFEKQWITIGWALEGAALLWLFHRVPHSGLRLVGVGLLIAAFARLALNPYLLEYHPRAATPIFNWYLYTYGIVTVCLFTGAALLAPPRNKIGNTNAQPLLFTLGTVLAFLLLNIEIADYFSQEGTFLTFQFSGNFARDMTYSIAWALFALFLLIVGIWRKIPGARYSALILLSVTILKLFLHDLARLNQLYRIGALIGVAVIAMLASLAYQRFFAISAKKEPPPNGPVS
jgi:uncharacterized membrane protein